ncbi:MAG: type II toxin-antitoxin system HipA family toxin [Candidatus Obscuribacterales bacterium]|nr:type II toxin-antitoxin system HipA family toxin [Candidatus Obscuribacterales bacterium]
MTDHKQLSVRLYGLPVGILEQDLRGHMRFTYLDTAARPLSISMPLGKQEYDNNNCVAFFGGLLPESDHARQLLGKRFGISPNSTFSLLREIGRDCAGAISFHAIDQPVRPYEDFDLEGRILSDKELLKYIHELPTRPLFIGVDYLRLSLAGVQNKAAVCLIDGQIAIPQHGCPTTHILKPAIERFTGTVENEYFCMKLAKRLGLSVADVEIRKAKDIQYLLVKRYDRIISGNQIRRIHQEDFCQALTVPTSHKYQNEGGPSFKQCFDLLRQTSTPVVDRTRLAQVMIFNYLMGNNDAHGKNFSLLYLPNDTIQLAPLYDVLSTRIYEDLTKKMAMKIGSKYELDNVEPRHWQQLCQDIGYSYPLLKETLLSQTEAILKAAREEMDLLQDRSFDMAVIANIVSFLDKHCARTLKRFSAQ